MWSSAGKTVKVKVADKVIELKENRSLFARMTIAARSRPDIDIQEAIGTYEFSSISRSLFGPDGSVLPCKDKSKLLNAVENVATTVHAVPDIPVQIQEESIIIIDAMVIVQQAAADGKNIKTCADFAKEYIRKLENKIFNYDTVHLVFDHYDLEFTLKQGTRDHRKGSIKDSRSYVCMDSTPIRTAMDTFLSSSKTKSSLTEYLSMKVLNHFTESEKSVIVSTKNGVHSTQQQPVMHLTTTQEEADTILILHALEAAKSRGVIHILSPDTDVFILALRRFPELGQQTCMILGAGEHQRIVPLRPIYEALGEDLAAALPGFHSFTGCDTTGKFAGKGKLTCWKVMQKASPNMLTAFKNLGSTITPTRETEAALEEFVCQLFQPQTKKKDVGQLRWEMFKRSQAESERLPPTAAVLKQHTLRAHYQAMIWCNDRNPQPNLPPPERYGWRMEDSTYVPIITTLKPAPDAVIELTRCGCGTSKCIGGRCSCKKAGLPCTEMCACEASPEKCMNTEPVNLMIDSDDETESDDDDVDY